MYTGAEMNVHQSESPYRNDEGRPQAVIRR